MGGGGAVKEPFKAISQPVEANVLLLQPQSRASRVALSIKIETT